MTASKPRHRGTSHLLALEPRMMFDAAAGAVVQGQMTGDGGHADHAIAFAQTHDAAPESRAGAAADMGYRDSRVVDPAAPTAADRSAPPAAGASAARHDVIFIDTAIDDYRQLAAEWAGRGDVILIDSGKDGIDQMRAALAGESDVAAIHIVSHGSEGVLYLGTTRIDQAAIEGDLAASLGAIGRSLNPGGDILLYGCDFAEGSDGARALAAFAQATHADVAASTDLTGYAGKGGDWVLESHVGDIQAHTLSSADWTHTLDPNVPVPIAVTPDSLTVTDSSGRVITTGSSGYTNSGGTDRSGPVGAGASARWAGAATLTDGTKVDLVATVTSISTGDTVSFNRPTTGTNGDDPTFLLRDASNGNSTNGDGANVQILWSLVVSGTNTPIAANVEFGILDIDGVGGNPNTRETVSVASDNLSYYTAERTTDIAIDPTLQRVSASGTQNENTDPTKPLSTKSEVTFDWTKVSSFTIGYSLAANNGVTTQAQFYQDGNADFKYSDPVSVSIPRLDLDANDSTAPGNDAHFTFTTGGADSPIVDSDVRVSNPMDVNSVIGATVTLTNAKAGDALHVGTLPSNITASVTSGNGTISVTLSGNGSEADYDAALRAVTFANTATTPDTTQRVIAVDFENTRLASATATSRIDINNAPVANPDRVTTPEDTATTIDVLRNDTDADGDALVVTAASAAHGTVTINHDGTLGYTPNADYNGDDTISYTISDSRGGTATSIVAVTVTPVNDPPRDVGTLPPQSAQDAQTVSYDTASGFTDVDGDTLTYSASGLPSTLSIDPRTGVISGTLDRSASQVNGGAYAIAVTATDPSNTSATQRFTLTVTNPPPVAQDDSATTHAGTATTIAVLANDHDPDGDPLTVTAAMPQYGSVRINPDGTLTYTPSAGFVGTDRIAYTISDGQGGTSSAIATVTVTNAAPTHTPIAAQAANDAQTVSLAAGSHFTDPDGDTLGFSATGLPPGLMIDPVTGIISGTIDRSASQANGGIYDSVVTADDGHGGTDRANVRWTVANPPPVAQNDSATTHAGTATTIAVLANDHDPDGDPLTVTAATPQNGSVRINPDGTLTYTPSAGFVGTDRIAYTISDGQGGTSNAVATVTVTNAAPTHTAIAAQSANDAQTVSLAAGSHFTDPDGDTLGFSTTGLPPGLTIDPVTGIISGTIDRSASQANGGIYDSVVTADDGHGGTDRASIRWTVTNPPPVAADDSATTPEDTAVTIAVLANDHDPDGDPLTVTGATAAHGTVAINPDGTITYTPNADYNGSDRIAYTISDGQGGTASAQVAVTVTPVDDAPRPVPIPASYATEDGAVIRLPAAAAFIDPDGDALTYTATGLPAGLSIDPVTGIISGTVDRSASQINGGRYTVTLTATDPSNASATQTGTVIVTNPPPVAVDDSATTPEDGVVVIPVLANDHDPDGDPLSVTGATAAHGTVAINPDGTITYTPNPLYRGADTIAYAISDGQGGTAAAHVAVTVTPVNHAPTAQPIAAQTGRDAQAIALGVGGFFGDADGDTLAYSATGLPPGLAIDPSTGRIAGTLDRSASRGSVYHVVVTATDPSRAQASSAFDWTIANPAPVAADDTATVAEDARVTIPVLANDRDPDDDPLTVTSATAQHGSVTIGTDGTLAYRPDAYFRGNDVIVYTIADGDGGTASASVLVTVTPVDHAPETIVAAPPPVAALEGTSVAVAAAPWFRDPDGDTLAYAATGLPKGLAIDPVSGAITGTIDHSAAAQAPGADGRYTVTVTATDPGGLSTSTVFAIQVANPAPVATDSIARTNEDSGVILPALANVRDPDGDPLTVISATAQHGTVTINPDGTLAYVPGPLFSGIDTVRYTVSDADGGTATAIVTVTVDPVNHAPVVPAQGAPIDAVGGRPVTIDALAGVTDIDGDHPTIVSASSANGSVAIAPDGTIRFTPDLGFVGTATLRYVVADGRGGFADATLVVRVADGRGADIEELLRIGRVTFVDPSPGFARIVAPDGVIRNPLTILDTVEHIRTLGTTAIGRQPVGDAVESIRTLRGTGVDPDHPVTAEVARIDALRDQRDAGDRLFDHRWGDFLVKGASGFSAAADGHAGIMVESVVRGGAVYVEVRDTAREGAPAIRSVDVRPAHGARPDWIRVDPRGLAIVERAADMDELHLVVRVTRADGHISTTPIVLQGATGEIEIDRAAPAPLHHHHHPRAAPLDATLTTHHAAARDHAAHIDRIFQ